MTGSLQLRRYLGARATMDRAEAAALAGIGIEEARLTDIANEKGEIELSPWPLTHNQEEPTMGQESIAADELRLLIERVERLEEEKKAIADDIKDVYAEAKARSYDTKTMRECVKLRKMAHVRQEREALLETYKAALGLDYSETTLGRATVERAAESETTISVDGGPAVPLATVKAALDIVQGRPKVSGIASDYTRDAAASAH